MAYILNWREQLDNKYAELPGIRGYYDFFCSGGTAVMKTRDKCGEGEFKNTRTHF